MFRRFGLAFGLALVAFSLATTTFADEHGGRGGGGDNRGRDGGDHGDRGDRGRQVQVVVPNAPNVIYQPRAAAPQCTTPDPSAATIDSVFNQFLSDGGLSVNQAALIGNALYLSANEVQQLSFEQIIAMTQCAGVSLDTLASILSGA